MVSTEVSARTSQQLNTSESKQEPIGLLIYDEVTKDVVLLKFTLEDVFDRSQWEKTELPSVILQQKKRA
ncbi:hypothetical protein IR194_07960 [Exiguobacterium sp. PBE]|nr:hypothetical protein IR194_07960 [Exiguobacterium sp. PBE]